jgi:mono/diheme cytochrome c family protein
MLLSATWMGSLCAQEPAENIAEKSEQAEQLFVRRVLPLLSARCLACHGADREKMEGSLDLTTEAGALRGGDSGETALVRGKPDKSPLLLAASRTSDDWSAMPPKEAEKLSAEQLAWLREWIAGGAPWPSAERQAQIAKSNADRWSVEDGVPVATSGGLSADWTSRKYKPDGLWAYQTLKMPEVPAGEPAANPIDRFLAARMSKGLIVAPRADRATLLRRATFDLTGLPPTPAEVAAFVADSRPDEAAFASVIDRLLDSPHYGERMAQHWLDVVRYADSSGFANDYERGNAWRYRDYVVRSFNADKPFDQFAREQIAGDEIDPENPELLIATGLLRMGPWELTGMEVAKVARQRFLDDVTNSVGETFLAHSLQCARCHDHKFDPIPTRDYYSLQAVFATTQLAERAAEFLPGENTAGFDEEHYLTARREELERVLAELDAALLANAEKWYAAEGRDVAPWKAAVEEAAQEGPAAKRRGLFEAARAILRKQGLAEKAYPPKLVGFTPQQFGLERVARKGLERLAWERDRYRPFALSVYSGRTPDVKSINAPVRMPAASARNAGELENTCILTGGDPFSPAEAVAPGVLSVIGDLGLTPIPDTVEGRRRAFADWVASPVNPLTPRVIANRVWLWHFGEALAGNPNNFGSTGKRPTHPELLDWLAATLVAEGWSLKSLHRRILTSAAYARSTEHPDRTAIAKLDPQGTSYAVFRPRRLTAEELRDAMLAATGELNPALGGIPCRPEINREVALQPRQVMGTFAAAWVPNPQPSQRHRRSLYVLKLRGLADPLLEVFNAPGPDFSCERREVSTVTPQVFALLNGDNTHARSLALAARAARETKTDDDAIRRCFELAYSRQPTADELAACLDHWQEIERLLPAEAEPRPLPPREIVREAIEENTGERFTFAETLYASRDFVPDLQPTDVDRHVRALADVCLALFNGSEFSYVY